MKNTAQRIKHVKIKNLFLRIVKIYYLVDIFIGAVTVVFLNLDCVCDYVTLAKLVLLSAFSLILDAFWFLPEISISSAGTIARHKAIGVNAIGYK